MEIKHVNGGSVETNELGDVDSLLMEESQKLFELFGKYNRQLLLIGEMQARKETTSEEGCSFFHIGLKEMSTNDFYKSFNRFLARLNYFIQSYTSGRYYIALNTSTINKDSDEEKENS